MSNEEATPQKITPKRVLKLIQSHHYEQAFANAQQLEDKKWKQLYSEIASAGLGQKYSRGNQLAVIANSVFLAKNGETERARAQMKKISDALKDENRTYFHLAAMQIYLDLKEYEQTLGEYELLLFYKGSKVELEKAEMLAKVAQTEIEKQMVGTGSIEEGEESYEMEEEV